MAITSTDVLFMKSSVGTSDGGAESGTELTSGVANGLWPDISDALRGTGGSRIKKFYIQNDSGTETMLSPSVWISSEPSGVDVDLGLGSASSSDDDNTAGNLVALVSNNKVSLQSSAADGRTATVIGLDALGAPLVEGVVVTGATPVLTVGTFSKVYAVEMSATSGSLTITIKEGSGGTITMGTIPSSNIVTWVWVSATSKGTGIRVFDVGPSTSIPIWCRQTWAAGVSAQRPTRQIVSVEENG